eukprot:1083373-Pelagomonas_calceolata.AAC.7
MYANVKVKHRKAIVKILEEQGVLTTGVASKAQQKGVLRAGPPGSVVECAAHLKHSNSKKRGDYAIQNELHA